MGEQKLTRSIAPVWSHAQGGRSDLRVLIVEFCAGRDVTAVPACDEALIPADLATNEASFLELVDLGVIRREESRRLASALRDLRWVVEAGQFELQPGLEDVHINIESWLTERAGEAAGKIHSGRSRNDQVACDVRLWHRERILTHLEAMCLAVGSMLDLADRECETVVPGFSHHQRAFVTTFGHLIAGHAEGWSRDLDRGLALFGRVNQSPLGAAAGFGTSWPLDRMRMAERLGFGGIVENSLDAVGARIEVETDAAMWLALWLTRCSSLAQDLILFSMEEFRWVKLAPEATTGSSIMPQKRNPDFAEVIKGKSAAVQGQVVSLLSLAKGQPSGYHRDSQYSKPIGQEIWREVESVPLVLQAVLETLEVDRARMRAATTGGFLEAAEWADAIAQESGLPFREVYTAVGIAVDACRTKGRLTVEAVNRALKESGRSFKLSTTVAERFKSPESLVGARRTLGSPNPERVRSHIEKLRKGVDSRRKTLKSLRSRLARADASRRSQILKLSQ